MPARARKNEKEENEKMSKLPSYMRPEQERQQGTVPTFTIGEKIEAAINSIEEVTGKYGKQLQFNITLQPSGWNAKAWVKYYPIPQPNQYLGKLCLAIQRVTGQQFSSLEGAINALKSYGKIYFRVTGFRTYEDNQYPKFAVVPELLPGEQPQQQLPQQQPPQQKPASPFPVGPPPTEMKGTPRERMIAFLKLNSGLIGRPLSDAEWNPVYEKYLIDDGVVVNMLKDEGLVYMDYQTGLPKIDEKARSLI
ncbi:MAG: hypothetical protein Q6361_09315 [Candidatus Hermodarchaeota archaeon]|nr:hypothetical protein [Candidatus Hermodarchaeota archaeon]